MDEDTVGGHRGGVTADIRAGSTIPRGIGGGVRGDHTAREPDRGGDGHRGGQEHVVYIAGGVRGGGGRVDGSGGTASIVAG